MAIEVGTVEIVIGSVEAIAEDGSVRILSVGDKVYAGEVITTGQAAAISIRFIDDSVMDLGRESQVILDQEIFDPLNPTVNDTNLDAQDDIAALQQSLLLGEDPTQDSDSTAAGGEIDDSQGDFSSVSIAHQTSTADVTSGFATTAPEALPTRITEEENTPNLIARPVFNGSTESIIVDEDGLAGANVDAKRDGEVSGTNSVTATGSFLDNFSFGVDGAAQATVISVNGQIANSKGIISIETNDYRLDVIAETGIYSFTLLKNVLEAGAGEKLQSAFDIPLRIVVENSIGDQVTGAITLHVDALDDIPVLTNNSEALIVDEDGLAGANIDAGHDGEISGTNSAAATGNLADNFSFGADGAAQTAIISVNGQVAVAGIITVETSDYRLDVTAETGAYTFTLLTNVLESGTGENLQSAFDIALNVVAEDGDGDQVTGAITLHVDALDDIPVLTNMSEVLVVDEDGLTGANLDANRDGEVVGSNSATATGNLADNFIFGADVAAQTAIISVNGQVAVAGIITVETSEYRLDVTAETGEYTFTLLSNVLEAGAGENLQSAFELALDVVVEDGDGDQITGAITLSVGALDDIPTVSNNRVVRLDDDAVSGANGNPGGVRDGADAVRTTGTLAHSYGADELGTTLLLDTGNVPRGYSYSLNSDSTVLTISQQQDGVNVDVVQLSLSDTTSGLYTVEQLNPIDHRDQRANIENNQAFTINYVVTDGDGDQVEGGIRVSVDDDTAVLVTDSETITVDEDGLIGANVDAGRDGEVVGTNSAKATGNLADNFSFGADGAAQAVIISVNGQVAVAGIITVETSDYRLDVTAETGAYTFTLLTNVLEAGAGENLQTSLAPRLNVVVEDGDGDRTTGLIPLNVGVLDDIPTVSFNRFVILDDDAVGGKNGNPGGLWDDVDAIRTTGTLAHSYGADELGTTLLLDTGNIPKGYSYTLNTDSTGLTISQQQDGTIVDVVQITLSDTTSGNYRVEQLNPINHNQEQVSTENNRPLLINYTVTDSDGDQAQGVMRISVDDDTAVLVTDSETITVDEDGLIGANVDAGRDGEVVGSNSATATGNLADNFSFGADGAAQSAIVSVNGQVAVAGIITVETSEYRLDVTAETGAYTFTLLTNVLENGAGENLQSAFDIALNVVAEDGDGDQVTGAITLHVDALDDIPVLTNNSEALVVDEDGLASANIDAGHDGEISGANSAAATGNLADNFSFGADGAAQTAIISVNGQVAVAGIITVETSEYRLDVTAATGAYTFTLLSNILEAGAGENVQSAFDIALNVVAEDGDGDQVTGAITLHVDALDDIATAINDSISTDEEQAIIIDVLNNDRLGADNAAIQTHSQPLNGNVVLNNNGTFTYTPSVNYSGNDSFSYTIVDGDGDLSTATVNISIASVADAPTLVMSVGEAVIQTGTEAIPQTIDRSNMMSADNGFVVEAFSPTGTAANLSSMPNGFGVTGPASGHTSELGFNSNLGLSESIKVSFDQSVSSVDVSFAWMNPRESATYIFFSNGVEVGSGVQNGGSDGIDPPISLQPDSGVAFDEVVFSSPGRGDDYLIHSIEFDIPTEVTTYNYDINIAAELTDSSETLSGVTISGLPAGVSILEVANPDGTYSPGTLTLVSERELSAEELNSIIGSVSSSDGSDSAETISNAKAAVDYIDFSSLSLSSWGGRSQDRAPSSETTLNESGLILAGNSWKAVDLSQLGVEPDFDWSNGTLVFEAKVTSQGELQGILFEHNLSNNSSVDQPNLIKVGGSQVWGTNANFTSETTDDGWQRVEVDLSTLDQSQGEFNHLVFVNDDDSAGNGTGSISFRNLSITDSPNGISLESDNLLEGTSGNDVLDGQSGDDILIGGAGDDILTGGEGSDIFVWNKEDVATPSHDIVTDFDKSQDVLNLADLLSNPADGYSIEGIDNGSGELQLNIGVADANGNITAPVQKIELTGLTIVGSADETLQNLLNSGAINDGI